MADYKACRDQNRSDADRVFSGGDCLVLKRTTDTDPYSVLAIVGSITDAQAIADALNGV